MKEIGAMRKTLIRKIWPQWVDASPHSLPPSLHPPPSIPPHPLHLSARGRPLDTALAVSQTFIVVVIIMLCCCFSDDGEAGVEMMRAKRRLEVLPTTD